MDNEITEPDKSRDRRKKAYLMAKEIGLTDDERHALAGYVLRRDATSWKGLSDNQMTRLLDAMEGFVLIHSLFLQRL